MINKNDVKKLAKIKLNNKENWIMSLYLNTDREKDPKEKYFTVFKDMAKYSLMMNKEVKGLNKDLEKNENFLKFDFSKKAKGVVIFSCQNEGLWEVYGLQVEVPNLITVEKNCYIKPLLTILEDYQKYCVVIVSKDKARIFTVYLGKIVEHFDVFDEVIGKHKKGGSSEARFRRHHKDEVHQHLKKVAEKLFIFFKKEKFDRIIIGSTPEVLPLFEKTLHPWLKERVTGKFHAELFADTNKILKESLIIEAGIEANEEKYMLNLLKNNLGPKKLAISGIDDTLFELQEGSLNTIIIKKGFKARGRQCIKCNYIDAWQGRNCPICEEKTITVEDIIEKAVKIAFDKNVDVEFIEGDNDFEKLGNIGGLLRY